jgi:hypothetical protein
LIIPFSVRALNTPCRLLPFCALLLAGTLTACKESSSGPPSSDAAALSVHLGDGQAANVGTPVAQAIAVRIVDADNDPVAGVRVTFAVKTGGGMIAGSSVLTDANGVATAGAWTLGTFLGTNTVEASATGLTKVTFSATALCAPGGTLALDGTLTAALSASDCKYVGGELTDRFTFTSTAQRAVRFSQTSQLFDTYLEIYDGVGNLLGANDDSAGIGGHPTSHLKMLLPAGTYHLSPSSFEAGETGDYSVVATAVPESGNTCELVFTTPGISTIGELATGDCATGGTTPYLFETFALVLRAGRTYTISMNSTVFDTYLELGILNGALVMSNDNAVGNGTNARITYTPTVSTFFVIVPSSAVQGVSGAYTLIIE